MAPIERSSESYEASLDWYAERLAESKAEVERMESRVRELELYELQRECRIEELEGDTLRLRALLRQAWEFPDYPGPGEGMVSTAEDYSQQNAWAADRARLDAAIRRALNG